MPVSAVQALSDDEKRFRYECLFCGEEVFLAAQGSIYKVTHFRHRSGNNDKKCEHYLSQYGSIYVSQKNRHNKQERLDFFFNSIHKYFCGTLCFNSDELKNYEDNNVEFELRSEKNANPFFSRNIDRQHFCENIPETFILEKYAATYFVSNTLSNRKIEYSLFEEEAPTFFKIQGDTEEYKAKYVKSKSIYTNVKYFVAWVGRNTAQIKLKNKQDVNIDEQFEFTTMGHHTVWGMVVTFKNKNPEIDDILQSWGYNLSTSEDLLLLWPPSYVDDDVNYLSSESVFLYSTFNIQYGNANIADKYIHRISSNIFKIDCQNDTRIVKKNVEIIIELDKSTMPRNVLMVQTLSNRIFTVPNNGTYYSFTSDGVKKLVKGQKNFLTPKTMITEYHSNYPIKQIFYKKKPDTPLETRFYDILANYWVLEKCSGSNIENAVKSSCIDNYFMRCKQEKSINLAILKLLMEE